MLGEPQASNSSRRTLAGGKIVFNDRNSIVDCTVRSLSDNGAELRMPSTLCVPGFFKLVVQPHGDVYCCEVEWRTETTLGVTFAGKPERPPTIAKKKAPYVSW